MHTMYLLFLTTLHNLNYITSILFVFLITTLTGYEIYNLVFKEDDKRISLPSSVLFGYSLFIIFISLLSYLFKGKIALISLIFLYGLIGITLLWYRRKTIKLPRLNKKVVINISLYFLITLFFFYVMANNVIGGDVIAYWGFANSFANGNFPMVSPWQPDLLANHHQAAFLYEGAVQAFAGADIRLVHALFGVLMSSTGFFLLWGVVRKRTGSEYLSLVPPAVVYLSYGGVYIFLSTKLTWLFHPEVNHVVERLPMMTDAKNRLGGVINLNDLLYVSHRTVALAGSFLMINILLTKMRLSEKYRPIIVALVTVPIISADEIGLPMIALSVLVWGIYNLTTYKNLKERLYFIKISSAALVLFLTLFFVVGSALRDSILTPAMGEARFQLTLDPHTMMSRTRGLMDAILTLGNSGWMIYIPHLWVFIFLLLALAYISRDGWLALLMSGGLGSLFAFLTVIHTYYPSNNDRFLSWMYDMFGFGVSYGLLLLYTRIKKKPWKYLLLSIWTLAFVPAIMIAFLYYGLKAKSDSFLNLHGMMPADQVLHWSRENIPNHRVFFVDEFLRGAGHSHLSIAGIQNFGLFIPVSPAHYKVHTPDYGYEAIDVINTLNPSSLKQLKVEYIYIMNNQLKFYPAERLLDLKNPVYFVSVYQDQVGVMYKVRESYYQQGKDIGNTIEHLPDVIKSENGRKPNIYIDKVPGLNYYIRAAIVLALKDSGNLYVVWGPGSFNYIETRITADLPDPSIKYDYLVLGPETDPSDICKCEKTLVIWEANGVKIYKTHGS